MCRPQGLPDRTSGISSGCARPAHPGRGHRPCHSATPGSGPARGGRWPSAGPGPSGLRGTVPLGRGKRGSRFLIPPEGAKAPSPLQWQGPSPLPQRHAEPRPAGGQSPRPAPAPPPAGASRPPGRALASVVPGPAGLHGTVPLGRGKRGSRFLVPPGEVKALSPPHQWQGPSPLPQCHAGMRTSRGPKPPASARPAPGGRFAPAGPGAGLCPSRTHRSTGHCPARAGETRVAFPDPARTDKSAVTAAMAGAIAPATAPRRDQDQPGAKAPGQRPPRPRRALRPRRVGRWPLPFPDLPVYGAPSRAGGGNAGRVS